MFALTSNVVQGNVREAPASSKVPQWVRRMLLRGLRPQAAERWPSMAELLEALEKNPSAKRKKWAGVTAGVLALAALGFAVRQGFAENRSVCTRRAGEAGRDLGAAGAGGPGAAPASPDPRGVPALGEGLRGRCVRDGEPRAHRLRAELGPDAQGGLRGDPDPARAVGRGHGPAHGLPAGAPRRPARAHRRVQPRRAARWSKTRSARPTRSPRSIGAPTSGSCAPIVRPPEDPATRARVAGLRDRLAAVKASFDAGHVRQAIRDAPPVVAEARAVGYKPLLAEALALSGDMSVKATDTTDAKRFLTEAFLVADASRHDEVRADVAATLVYVVGSQEGRFEEAKRWGETAESVLERMGGHELLRAWLLNDLGAVYVQHGYNDEALRANLEAVALKEKALGPDHPDVGISEGNVAVVLEEAGRIQEALTHIDRSVALLENGLGAAHPELATQLNNRGEILNLLGRNEEARKSFERARVIWERELGLDNRNLGYALTGIGISFLAEGSPQSGLVPLERAHKIREAQETDPAKRAETSFALARALWDSNRDRVRARVLAEEARVGYGLAPRKDKLRAEVEGWLDAHPTS